MPKKIGTDEVCAQLYRKWLVSVPDWKTKEYVRVTYKEFRRAMLEDSFLVSEMSIRAKWELLELSGVFYQCTKSSAVIDCKALIHTAKLDGALKYIYIYTDKTDSQTEAGE